MDKITRRNALQALPILGLAAIVPPPAVAAERPDAELFQLEAEFNAAYDRCDAAGARTLRIEKQANAAMPPKPQSRPLPKGVGDIDAINEHLREDHERLAAWEQECKAISREMGLHESDAAASRLAEKVADAAHAVLDAPATTVDGILAKLRVHDRWEFETKGVLSAIKADLQAIADPAI